MSWKSIIISNPCKLSLKDNHMILERHEQANVRICLDDMAILVIETAQCTVTTALLSAISSAGVAMYTCDSSHMPVGLMSAFGTHSRHSKTAKAQASWSEPFKKRTWQSIIKSKITNQAKVLEMIGNDISAKQLRAIARNVTSGDVGNREAQAACVYWRGLFDDFIRGGFCIRNSALNYGYTILRGAVARSLCGSGFVPTFGLFHDNQLNAFNLADDIIEPFRPWVDMMVHEMFAHESSPSTLSSDDKHQLATILYEKCYINGRYETLLNSCDIVSSSLMNASFAKSSSTFLLPSCGDRKPSKLDD